MRKTMLLLALVVTAASFTSCGSDSLDLTGSWSMVANRTFSFALTIRHNGSEITGTMDSLSDAEPDTPIAGTLKGSSITFRRTGSWYTQDYTGSVTPDGKTMAGTFSQDGAAARFDWSATR